MRTTAPGGAMPVKLPIAGAPGRDTGQAASGTNTGGRTVKSPSRTGVGGLWGVAVGERVDGAGDAGWTEARDWADAAACKVAGSAVTTPCRAAEVPAAAIAAAA